MKNVILYMTLVTLVACGSAQKVNKQELKKVKRVAFVLYSVPEHIQFREDPREADKIDSLWDVAKKVAAEATKGDGEYASDLSYDRFIRDINKRKDLGFKVLKKKDLTRNKKFMALVKKYKKDDEPTEEVEQSTTGKILGALAAFGGGEDKSLSKSPKHLPSFGLIKRWRSGNALLGNKEEKEFINEALKVLEVDALLAINDMGYSFLCKACVAGTGAATTGSAFHATLLGRDGKVLMNMNQWFSYTHDETATTAGIVNPNGQKELFQAHGEKLAKVFTTQYLDAVKEE